MHQILTNKHTIRTFFAHFKLFRTTAAYKKKCKRGWLLRSPCTNVVISDKTERNTKVKNDKTERKNLSISDKTERNERFR